MRPDHSTLCCAIFQCGMACLLHMVSVCCGVLAFALSYLYTIALFIPVLTVLLLLLLLLLYSATMRCCGVLCCAVLHCAVLCCAMLRCAVLCCAVLCCAARCGAVRCGAVLCCVELCCMHCIALLHALHCPVELPNTANLSRVGFYIHHNINA